MKRKIFWLFTCACFLLAFKKLNDVLTDVGTTLQDVKKYTLEEIAGNNFDLPHYTSKIRDACKKLPPGVREATMMSLGQVVKDYVQSPEFQSEYFAYIQNGNGRKIRGPEALDDAQFASEKQKRVEQLLKGMTTPEALKVYAQVMDGQIEMGKSQLEIMKSNPDYPAGRTKEEIEKDLNEAKMIRALYPADPEKFKTKSAEFIVEQQMQIQNNNQKARDAENKKKLDQLKDYRSIIKKELNQFLDISAGIDFNAQTMQKGDKTVFVNQAYEAKPLAWKLCFRSGKEAVDGARKFARQWLDEMK